MENFLLKLLIVRQPRRERGPYITASNIRSSHAMKYIPVYERHESFAVVAVGYRRSFIMKSLGISPLYERVQVTRFIKNEFEIRDMPLIGAWYREYRPAAGQIANRGRCSSASLRQTIIALPSPQPPTCSPAGLIPNKEQSHRGSLSRSSSTIRASLPIHESVSDFAFFARRERSSIPGKSCVRSSSERNIRTYRSL